MNANVLLIDIPHNHIKNILLYYVIEQNILTKKKNDDYKLQTIILVRNKLLKLFS